MSILNFRKSLIIAILFSVFGTLAIPQKAEAQWATFDVPHTAVTGALSGTNAVNSTMLTTKEYLADMVVNLFVKATIKRIVNSTVKWINSGFQGSPGFVTNPEKFFTDIADGIAGQLIYNNPNWRFMCSSFKTKVQLAISRNYTNQGNDRFQCKISSVVNNFDNFMGDFNQGGWDGFISITQNSQNNPIGLYTNWNNSLTQTINSKVDQQKQDLIGSNGLLSFNTCPGGRLTQTDIDGLNELGDNGDGMIATYKVGDCPGGEEVSTPGSVIKDQLDSVLTLDNQSLVTADEINEIIGALAGQLTNRLVGGIGKGLRSLTSSGSGNRGGSFTDELLNDPDDGADALDTARNAAVTKLNSQQYPCFDPKTQKAGTSPNADGRPCTPDPYYEPDPNLTGAAGTFCDLADDSVGIRIGSSDCCKATDQACIDAARAANGGGGAGGGGTGGGGSGTFRPFVASDGSNVTSVPLDADCQNASFDEIVTRAGQIYYANPAVNAASGNTIANIIMNMNCGPGGTLP